jgi:hypothetical protein
MDDKPKAANDNELVLDPALKSRITVRAPLTFKKPTKKQLKDVFNPKAAAPAKKIKTAKLDKDGNTPLFRAIDAENMKEVKRLLSTGNDPNQTAGDGTTPLMAAVTARKNELAQLLLDAGATVRLEQIDHAINYTIGNYKSTPAEQRLDFLLIDAFKKQGGNGAELSPFLHNAAHADDAALVKKLSQAGADINHTRPWSRPYSLESGTFTPAMVAARSGLDTLKAVLEEGGSAKDAFNYYCNSRGMGDDPVNTEARGVFLQHAAETGQMLPIEDAKAQAHDNLITDMTTNPPPGLKYRNIGRPITRAMAENWLRQSRRR